MGGPASSVVAEIYMQSHESTALTTTDTPPKVWKRFVDDVYAIIHRNDLNAFHKHINNLHPKIQFTVEHESNRCLPFLDTLVTRNDNGNLSVSVYRKPTHTDQYLNFESNHQMSCKESVVSSLINRANDVISNIDDRNKEMQHIDSVLKENGYKKHVIEKVKKQIIRKKNNVLSETETEEIVATVNLPYIPGVSNTLKQIFCKHKIKGIFNSKDTLRKILSHPKDKIPEGRNNNVVYQIPCSDCNAVYIGETKRKFDCRVQEHKKAVQNGDISKNEIADHSWTKNHNFNWDGKKILDREKKWTARKVKETICQY